MPDLPIPAEAAIRSRCGVRSFSLGIEYFRDGSVIETQRQGRTLKAQCMGSQGGPYRLSITFGKSAIETASCSCPVGGGGGCKHIAAMLLAWRADPSEFTEVEALDDALAKRSREELIAMVKLMVRRKPELESLVNAPLPGAKGKAKKPASAAAFQKQAAQVLGGCGQSWGDMAQASDELQAIVETGTAFAENGECASAAAVYAGVADAILEDDMALNDEEGHLAGVVQTCIEGLTACLTPDKGVEAPPREPILRALFQAMAWDIDAGGVGMGDGVTETLLESTTPEERRVIAAWVRERLPAAEDWARETYGSILLSLEADVIDAETYLRLCRETGRYADAVEKLLQLGRVDEAVKEADQIKEHELCSMADRFVAHKQPAVAEALVQRRAERTEKWFQTQMLEWLLKRRLLSNDDGGALGLAARICKSQPTIERYRQLRELAGKAGRWDKLRPITMGDIEKAKLVDLLIQIYLDEGAIDLALETLSRSTVQTSNSLAVAKAAETSRPRAALDIYQKCAENIVKGRSRASYSDACGHLKKMRQLYTRIGKPEDWRAYIATLRGENKRVRTLIEELDSHGVI